VNPTTLALVLATALIALGLVTSWYQARGLHGLAARRHVPSDEYAYFRGRYRRRLLTGAILVSIGALIGGAYLSGMERAADRLGEERPPAADPDTPKPPMTDAEKQFVRFWGVYWILVLILVFALVSLATIDAVATRRYWLSQYRILRDDHTAKLRRDLAVYKQAREQARAGRLRGNPGTATDD
jgi:hypothetical protein